MPEYGAYRFPGQSKGESSYPTDVISLTPRLTECEVRALLVEALVYARHVEDPGLPEGVNLWSVPPFHPP
jgi:hypothetical protein